MKRTPWYPTSSMTWKIGNEFAPFHPDASHVEPGYRDGWNACYAAMNDERDRLRAENEALRATLLDNLSMAEAPAGVKMLVIHDTAQVEKLRAAVTALRSIVHSDRVIAAQRIHIESTGIVDDGAMRRVAEYDAALRLADEAMKERAA